MSICRAVEEFKRIRGINKNKTLKLEYAMMFYSDVCYATAWSFAAGFCFSFRRPVCMCECI